MGILDFFRRNKNKTKRKVHSNVSPEKQALNLKYRSGTECQVQFADMLEIPVGPNGETKLVQVAEVMYNEPDGTFSKRTIYMDPMQMQDQNGNIFYATDSYYQYLLQQNMALVKGFFQKEQLSRIENNYIGHIGTDSKTGQYTRSYDRMLKVFYDRELTYKKQMKQYNAEQQFEQELRNKTRSINEIGPHIKTSHAQVLTKEDYEQYYGDR